MKSEGRFTHKVLDWLTDWLYFISTSLIVSYSSERLSNQITMTPAEELLIRWLSCCLPVQVQAPHLSYGTVDFLLLVANIIANNSAHTVGIELRKYRVQIEERSPRFNNEGDVLSAEKQQWVESAEFQWWSDCTKHCNSAVLQSQFNMFNPNSSICVLYSILFAFTVSLFLWPIFHHFPNFRSLKFHLIAHSGY